MIKRTLVLALTIIFSLGVFSLAACTKNTLGEYKTEGKAAIDTHIATKNQDDYTSEKWTDLLNMAFEDKQAIDEAKSKADVDTAVTMAKENIDKADTGHYEIDLDAYKVKAKALIDTHVATKNQDDYTTEKWTDLLNLAVVGKQAVDNAANKGEIDTAVANAKMVMNTVLTEEQEMTDFVLTISVNETIKRQGEDFVVNIELRNKREEDYEIAAFILFQWYISDWVIEVDYDVPEQPLFITLEKGGKYQEVRHIPIEQSSSTLSNSAQPSGQYELKVRANFYLNYGSENQEHFEIWSNSIILKVLEK